MIKRTIILIVIAFLISLITISVSKSDVSIKGVVSKSFGTNLGRDIDGDRDLDWAFIGDNIATINSDDYANCLALDSEGNVYVAGESYKGNNADVYVMKLRNDGILDSGFGNNGKVVFDNIAGGNWRDYANYLYVDNQNNIYITGKSKNKKGNYDMYVMKLKNSGSLDNNFGKNGIVILDNITGSSLDDVGETLYVDDKSNIYVAGESYKNSDYSVVYVMRLKSDGRVDEFFGKDGKVVFDNIIGFKGKDYVSSLYVDSKGNIYLGGRSYGGATYKATDGREVYIYKGYLIKLNNDGSLDSKFGKDGKVIFDFWKRGSKVSKSMYVDSEGNIYVAGYKVNDDKTSDVYVMKLGNDGSLDSRFGNKGIVMIDKIKDGVNPSWSVANSLYVDNYGNIYVTGYTFDGDSSIYVMKLKNNGDLDNTFGDEGILLINNVADRGSNKVDRSNFLYLDKNGKIYITGESRGTKSLDMFIIKIE